jgi:5'-3' exonuclease
MGIKDLYKVIKEAAPGYLVEYHYSELSGLRIAVDISIFLYRHIRTAGKPNWTNLFVLFLTGFKKYGIKMVCIFDGPNPPPEKNREQGRRREEVKRGIDRMNRCIQIRNDLQDNYIPFCKDIKQKLVNECKTLISPQKGRPDTTNYYDISDIVDALNSKIEKLEKQTIPITDDDKEQAFKIVESLGLAAFKADGEAETLCAYLAINGDVDAVLTEDTDVLAYGTPFMLSFKQDIKFGDEKLYGIYFESLLEEMEMNLDEFRDLCILLSCDYNDRVKGYPPDGKKRKNPICIGASRALCMIREYRRLEEVSKYLEDSKPLIYERCRFLFTIPKKIPVKDLENKEGSIIPFNKHLNKEELVKYLPGGKISFSAQRMIEHISKSYKPANLHFEDSDSESDFLENQNSESDFLENQNSESDFLENQNSENCKTNEEFSSFSDFESPEEHSVV